MEQIGVTTDLIDFVKKNYKKDLIDVLFELGFDTRPVARDFFILKKNCVIRCPSNPRNFRVANVLFGKKNRKHPAHTLYNEYNSYILDAPSILYPLDVQVLPCAADKNDVDLEHNKKANAILQAHQTEVNPDLLKEIDELKGHTL